MIKKTSSLLIFWALILFFASICWGKEVKIPAKVNPTGKYKTLIQVLPCPKDKGRYGEYYDYGYWGGGDLCGEQGEAGFWVWSYPNWYIFKEKQGPGVIARQQKTFSQNIIRQWAKEAQASSEYGNSAWSARQATGSPDTKACGDYKTAWAPKPSGNEPEWIKLFFQQPVHVTKIRVHETYNTGSIKKVKLIDIQGNIHVVWQGKDITSCPGWFEINIKQTPYLSNTIILETEISGWEEIDAVELIGIK